MKKILLTLFIVLIYKGFGLNLLGQNTDKLPRNIPELQGVSSSGIIDFLNAIDTGRQEIHSFMFLRHSKVIGEGWWNPYGPDYKHLMYSASKTFTATAIGLAVTEGRLKLPEPLRLQPAMLKKVLVHRQSNVSFQKLMVLSASL